MSAVAVTYSKPAKDFSLIQSLKGTPDGSVRSKVSELTRKGYSLNDGHLIKIFSLEIFYGDGHTSEKEISRSVFPTSSADS